MIVKSFGCSFIFGNDLSDDVSSRQFDWSENGIYIRPSNLTWPSLLAKDYGYEYSSCALPGIGNFQILESILKEINSASDCFFIIQWTWIDRFDYENQQRTHEDNFWNTILPSSKSPIADLYFKQLHSQYRDKLSTLTYIKTAIDALQQNNVPFIMTNIDDLVFEEIWHSNAAIEYLQNFTRPYITDFDGMNFLDWAIKNNYPISSSMHPLELSHEKAAKLIKSYNLL